MNAAGLSYRERFAARACHVEAGAAHSNLSHEGAGSWGVDPRPTLLGLAPVVPIVLGLLDCSRRLPQPQKLVPQLKLRERCGPRMPPVALPNGAVSSNDGLQAESRHPDKLLGQRMYMTMGADASLPAAA